MLDVFAMLLKHITSASNWTDTMGSNLILCGELTPDYGSDYE